MNCKICNTPTTVFDKTTVLNKFSVKYHVCPYCGFVQTEEPYWLSEAYSSAISNSDIGLVQRNIMLADNVNTILKVLGNVESCLDYGGGYGMFVRMMRDRGWDFEWYDEYCDNLFAQKHEKSRDHYDVVTAFEVLEHLPNPNETLEEIFGLCHTFICTTEIISTPPPPINDWWYYSPEHGQHISFYSNKSLQMIAEKFGKCLFSGYGVHIFSNCPLPSKKTRTAFRYPKLAKKLYHLQDKPSLLGVDYYNLTGKNI